MCRQNIKTGKNYFLGKLPYKVLKSKLLNSTL